VIVYPRKYPALCVIKISTLSIEARIGQIWMPDAVRSWLDLEQSVSCKCDG
jgi:hypothetical protein